MANMIGAFFEKGEDTKNIFGWLKISKSPEYEKHRNKHDVIYIDFSKMPEDCESYDQYISRIINRLKKDLNHKRRSTKINFIFKQSVKRSWIC